jgi:hypothetical protein
MPRGGGGSGSGSVLPDAFQLRLVAHGMARASIVCRVQLYPTCDRAQASKPLASTDPRRSPNPPPPQPDLVKWLEQHRDDAGPLPGKARLLRASAHEARGILEGLAYWGLA